VEEADAPVPAAAWHLDAAEADALKQSAASPPSHRQQAFERVEALAVQPHHHLPVSRCPVLPDLQRP
jgi:hypothetical protein